MFTPVYTMPAWLQVFARNNPVTLVANLLRALSVGEVLPCPRGEVLPCPTWASMSLPVFLWIVGITAVAAPLAVNRYRQA
ncbi:unannotated protein [freshwater metagenome]|uniref:Unannotated protein n=1 Tax=freshwater metagenome TaxID=449393 RepID=A0A6J7M904_9ZZZZ